MLLVRDSSPLSPNSGDRHARNPVPRRHFDSRGHAVAGDRLQRGASSAAALGTRHDPETDRCFASSLIDAPGLRTLPREAQLS